MAADLSSSIKVYREIDLRHEFYKSLGTGARVSGILEELNCLREIKDARDEIYMVQSVFKRQATVLGEENEKLDLARKEWTALDELAIRVENSVSQTKFPVPCNS